MNTKIEIPLSKTKSALPILFLLILGISGLFAFLWPELFTKASKYESTRMLGIANVAISLGLMIPFTRKLFTKKAGLIIDKDGITDNSNGTYTGLIEWNDITGVKTVRNGFLKTVVVLTNKPEKYINKAKKIVQPAMGKALRLHGSPLLIVSSRLKIKHDDLHKLITGEFEKVKRTTT